MARHISPSGLEHIKRWEGLRLEVYYDSAGILTIGYGHTGRAGPPPVIPARDSSSVPVRDKDRSAPFVPSGLSSGRDFAPQLVQPGMTITQAQAEALLLRDLVQFERAVETLVKVPLSDNQFAALVSFCFNVGVKAFKSSTLLKKLNSGNYEAIPSELMKWVYAGGTPLRGLTNRRAAEAGLWAKGEFVSSGYVKPVPVNDNPVKKPETLGLWLVLWLA